MKYLLVILLIAAWGTPSLAGTDVAPAQKPKDTRSDADRALYKGIKEHDPAQVQAAIDKGADANAPAIKRVCSSPLMAALSACGAGPSKSEIDAERAARDVQIVKLLLDHKADPNSAGDHGCPAMIWGVYTRMPEVVSLLIDHGGEVNPEKGRKPLNDAITVDSPAIVRLLVEKGADVNAHSNSTSTPLHMALRRKGRTPNAEEIIKILEAAGAVDEPDKAEAASEPRPKKK